VLSSCVTNFAYALFMMRYTFISAFVSDGMYMLCKLLNSTENSHYTRGEITFASRKHVLNPVIK